MMQLTREAPDTAKIAMAADVLRAQRTIRLRACGTSMLPALWPGDLLTIEPFAVAQAAVGDIVLVARDGRFFIHRLIQIGGSCDAAAWITRGDAMPERDPPVSAEQIIGRVSQVERNDREFIVPRHLPASSRRFAKLIAHSDLLRSAVVRGIALRQKLSRPRLYVEEPSAMIPAAASLRQPQSPPAPLFEK
jgi:hypothetical protein